MKQKMYNYVRQLCKVLVRKRKANIAGYILETASSRKTEVIVLKIKNISTSKSDNNLQFLWHQKDDIPVYDSKGDIVSYSEYACWLVRMQNCYIYSGTSFILDNKKMIAYADLLDLENPNHDNSYGALEFCFKNTGILMGPKGESIPIKKGIFLCGKASFNYYHLMVEIFPRLYFLTKANGFKDYPLLVDAVVWNTPQFKEILDILNVDKRDVILINTNNSYKVEDLIVPSDGSRMPIKFFDVKLFDYKDCQLHEKSVLHIRDIIIAKLLQQTHSPVLPNKRIFISRKTVLKRRPCNESDLWEVAKQNDFVKLSPEDYSFSEQVNLFFNCCFLAGNTGGALTNILFMQKDTSVLYWISEINQHLTFFINVAKAVGCNISYVTGKPEKQSDTSDIHSYFYINPQTFREKLEMMLN